MLRLAVAACGFLVFIYLLKRELPGLRVREMLDSIWRPCVGFALMALALLGLHSMGGMPVIAQLLLKMTLGATVFAVGILALWRMAGCPEGAESYLLEKLKLDQVVGRLLHRPPANLR